MAMERWEQTQSIAPEASIETKGFTQEQREALEAQGYVFYSWLNQTKQSIKALRDSGHKFRLDWHRSQPDLEALLPEHSEVAIKREQLFLPNSQGGTFDEQLIMVKEFSKELGIKIPGVEAIVGNAADYVRLAFKHLDKTESEDRLFGESDNYYYTRTTTPYGSFVVHVGNFSAEDGLDVNAWIGDTNNVSFRVAPLVVPMFNVPPKV